VSDGSGQLAALAEGQLRFRLRLDRQRLSDPELLVASQQAGGAVILVGSTTGRVFAVTPNGVVRWFHSGAWPVTAAPATFTDGSRRVAVAQSPELVILDEAGQQTAAIRMPAGIRAGPARVGPLVVCGDGRGQLVAFGSDGARRWQRDLGSGIRALRAVPEDASVAALTEDGRLWRLAADGELLGAASGGAPFVAVGSGAGIDLLLVQADHSLWQLEGRTGRRRRLLELPAATTALLRDERGPGSSVVVTADGQVTWREFGR